MLVEVVDSYLESVVAQLRFHDFGDEFPLTSCQTGSHSGHVNRGVICKGKISDSDQSFANGVVPNWRSSLVSFGRMELFGPGPCSSAISIMRSFRICILLAE
jgi:hypothetical protein